MLYTWQKQLQKHGSEGAFRGPGKLPLAEQDEIARLKHELAKVTQERDILKKGAEIQKEIQKYRSRFVFRKIRLRYFLFSSSST